MHSINRCVLVAVLPGLQGWSAGGPDRQMPSDGISSMMASDPNRNWVPVQQSLLAVMMTVSATDHKRLLRCNHFYSFSLTNGLV
jgi:hypothetical protein